MNEFDLIEKIRTRFADQQGTATVGIGDDCAIVPPQTRPTATTVDTCVEGVHFRPSWLSWHDVGWRCQVAAHSDLLAMGATPGHTLVALTLGPTTGERDVLEFFEGVHEACHALGTSLIGGNLSSGPSFSATTTALGPVPGEPILRRGARPGDGIYVTGQVGGAGLGLAVLQNRDQDHPCEIHGEGPLVARWRRPPVRLPESKFVQTCATAAIDISDGLFQDLHHLCKASKVGARIKASLIPTQDGFQDVARALRLDPLALFNGGEDYELLFTSSEEEPATSVATRIGTVVSGGQIEVIGHNNLTLEIPPGYQHQTLKKD